MTDYASGGLRRTYWARGEAACVDCPARWSSGSALSLAARHARSTGHVVTAKTITEALYEPAPASAAAMIRAAS